MGLVSVNCMVLILECFELNPYCDMNILLESNYIVNVDHTVTVHSHRGRLPNASIVFPIQ